MKKIQQDDRQFKDRLQRFEGAFGSDLRGTLLVMQGPESLSYHER